MSYIADHLHCGTLYRGGHERSLMINLFVFADIKIGVLGNKKFVSLFFFFFGTDEQSFSVLDRYLPALAK